MLRLSDTQRADFVNAVNAAQQVPELAPRVMSIYTDVQRQIDIRKPRCDVSGRCCQFEKFGHLLFVSTAEVAAFVQQSPQLFSSGLTVDEGCPFQVDRLCTVHTIRPFGCRIFFCDPTASDWQQDQYETFHLLLRQLHDELKIAYFYVEWREALRAVAMQFSTVRE